MNEKLAKGLARPTDHWLLLARAPLVLAGWALLACTSRRGGRRGSIR
ncbi:MAG: hypothetical protein NTW28_29065 [Candidatus Solibacter sp.]|nr:hypothetical protein [Candidatus Solibacter sp.]